MVLHQSVNDCEDERRTTSDYCKRKNDSEEGRVRGRRYFIAVTPTITSSAGRGRCFPHAAPLHVTTLATEDPSPTTNNPPRIYHCVAQLGVANFLNDGCNMGSYRRGVLYTTAFKYNCELKISRVMYSIDMTARLSIA